jgi:hypothetical protein
MRARLAAQESSPRPPRPRVTVRVLIVLVALCSLLLGYAGGYYRLSRRGMAEAREVSIDGFLYVPFAEAAASEDLTRHYALATFYAPLNWIDRVIFGAPSPWISIMWRLSG